MQQSKKKRLKLFIPHQRINELSSSKYLQFDTFCCKHLKTRGSSRKVYFQINLWYFGFQRFSARSWIIKVSHRLSASYPSLLSKVLANHYSPLSDEQTAAQPANSPPSSLTRGKWLTRKFCLWMNHSGKHKYLRGTRKWKGGRERGKKKMWAEAGVTSKSSASASCLFTVCALCSACMSPLSGFSASGISDCNVALWWV